MNVINTIAPVFLTIILGLLLRQRGFLSAELTRGINRLAYWVGLPTLLFYKLASAGFNMQIAGRTYAVVLGGMFTCLVLALIIGILLRIPSETMGTFVQGAYRGNLAFVGFAVIVYSFASYPATERHTAEAIAALVLGMTVPVYNILSVLVLLVSRHSINWNFPKIILKRLLTNPLLISCLAGIAYSMFLPPLPMALARSCQAVGQMALPLALLAIGATLATEKVAGCVTPAIVSSLIKIAAAPIAGLLLAKWLNLNGTETKIALIFLACPTAIASYTLTTEIGGHPKLAAAIVVISTVLAAISLSVVLAIG